MSYKQERADLKKQLEECGRQNNRIIAAQARRQIQLRYSAYLTSMLLDIIAEKYGI